MDGQEVPVVQHSDSHESHSSDLDDQDGFGHENVTSPMSPSSELSDLEEEVRETSQYHDNPDTSDHEEGPAEEEEDEDKPDSSVNESMEMLDSSINESVEIVKHDKSLVSDTVACKGAGHEEVAQEDTKRVLRSSTEIKQELLREKIQSHGSCLANGLSLLWTGELYCDCILVVDEDEMKCHSCVIASFSPLLQIKLNSAQNKTRLEANRVFIVLDLTGTMTYEDLEPLIRYMYTGEMRFKRPQLYGILKTAQFLGLKEIQTFCFIWMSQNITVKPTIASLKPECLEVVNVHVGTGKTSEDTTESNSVTAAPNMNGKDDEFIFQDYIDILNSWQRAVTDDAPNVTESADNSRNMLKESSGAKLLNSLQLQGKDQVLASIDVSSSSSGKILEAPLENLVGAQKRKFRACRRQPLRFNAGDTAENLFSSQVFAPTDMLYVNFNNQKYLTPEDKGKNNKRIVVVLPSSSSSPGIDVKLKNARKSQPRKLIKRKRKVKTELDTDMTEFDDDDEGNEEEDLEDVEGTGKKKKKKRGKRKHSKSRGSTEFVISIPGETIKCFKTRNEHDRLTLRCPKCNRPFTDPNLMKHHMENHNNNTLFSCHICGHGFMRGCDLSSHIRRHTSIKCSHCSFTTKAPKKFVVHSEKEHGITRPFVCTHEGCTYAAQKHHQLYDHMAIHAEIKPFKCIHCGKTCAHRSGLASHIKSCLQKRDRICDVCGKGFNQLGTLKSHRRIHFGEKPFHCTECPSSFSDQRTLKRHLTIHLKGGRGQPYVSKKAAATNVIDQPRPVAPVSEPNTNTNRKVQDPDFRYMPQAFSAAPKPACAVPEQQRNLTLNQKPVKVPNLDVPQQHFIKRSENGQPEPTQPMYAQMGTFQEPLRKLPPAPPPPGNDSMRSLDLYQQNSNLAHAQPPMTAGYAPSFAVPFSPLVPPEFYSQGHLATGHLEMHPHHSLAPFGGRPPSSYQQLHDYSMANVWKSAHEDLNSQLHVHNHTYE